VFGDSAYVNNGYFITPFKSVRSGPKDAFNFYQSQLRITVECCFGMLVGRWGLLHRAFPQAMSLKKVTGITLCLCRLHNFCIDHRGDHLIARPLEADERECFVHGGLDPNTDQFPGEILNGGDHHDDTSRIFRQNFGRVGQTPSSVLPRDRLVKLVEDLGLKRPLPPTW
jgi:DDE superfamily endonuclease